MFFSLFGLDALSNNQFSARYGDEKDKYTSAQLSSTNNLIKSSFMRERRSFMMFNRRARPQHSVAISAAAQLQDGTEHLYNKYELHLIIIALKNSKDAVSWEWQPWVLLSIWSVVTRLRAEVENK